MNILITGGASGLGEAITYKLAENKDNIVNFTYCSSRDKAQQIEKSITNSRAFFCDFNENKSIDDFILQIESMNPDVLINNAITGMIKKHFHKIEPGEFESSFKQNVIPVIKITQKVIEQFKKKKSGKIINILSTAIFETPIGWSEYAANKAYILSLSNSWAKEFAKFNITSNCISPSFMLTAFNKDLDERIIEKIKSKSPNGELLSINDTANVISSFLNKDTEISGNNYIINSKEDVI